VENAADDRQGGCGGQRDERAGEAARHLVRADAGRGWCAVQRDQTEREKGGTKGVGGLVRARTKIERRHGFRSFSELGLDI